jgi:hypothetical protein
MKMKTPEPIRHPHGFVRRSAIAFCAVAVIAAPLWAANPLPVVNAGFEQPVVGNDGSTGPIPSDWTALNGGTVNVLNPSTADLSAEAPEGFNVASVTSSALETGLGQILTSQLQADAGYTLVVKVANTLFTTGFPGYRVQLVADGTVLAEDDNSQVIAEDTVVTSTVTYTYNAGLHAALVGKPLQIRLLSKGLVAGQEVAFDDVRLSVALGSPLANAGGPYTVPIGGSLSLNGSGSLPSDGQTITLYEWDINNDGDFSDASGATPASISTQDLLNVWGMGLGLNPIKLRVTDSAAKTAIAQGTVALTTLPIPVAYWPMRDGLPGQTVPATAGAINDVIDNPSHPATNATPNNASSSFAADPKRGIVWKTVEGNRLNAGTQGIDLNDGFTWSLWVNVATSNIGDPGADSIMGTRQGSPWHKIDLTSIGNWNGNVPASGSYPNLANGQWTHIAYVGDMTGRRLYVNGVSVGTSTNVAAPTFNGALEIGGTSNFSEDITGLYSDVAVWNVRLAEDKIIDLFNGANIIPDNTAPVLAATTPEGGATAAATPNGLLAIFDEPVSVGTGDIRIFNQAGPTLVATIAVTDATQVTATGAGLLIKPTAALLAGATYFVEMDGGVVKNAANLNFAGFTGSATWSFTVDDVAPTVVSISSPALPVTIYGLPSIPYSVAFDKNYIDDATVTSADFVNAGTASITVGAVTRVSAASAPAVYTFDVTPTSAGTVQLRLAGTVSDLLGNTVVTPVDDDTTHTFADPGSELAKKTITFNGSFSWAQGGNPSTNTFNASGSDKLVVVATGEHNFGGVLSSNIVSITYDGVALTKAVEINPIAVSAGGHGQTAHDIWYLDEPGLVHSSGRIVATVDGNGMNYVYTAIGLSGTAPGVGAVAGISARSSVNLITSSTSSMVISAVGMGGNGNTAANATVNPTSPAQAVKISNLVAGSNWASHVTARTSGVAVANNTYSFSTALTDVATITAEFLAAPVDLVPPTLAPADIVDNQSGGPVLEGLPVIYTLTFSESMAPLSITADDFENAGSSAIIINSVTVTGNVVTVSLTPGAGTLRLQVKAGAAITDKSGNPLDTTSAIADDTIITVNPDIAPPVVVTLSPANGATGTTTAPLLVATFSENITKGTGKIEVRRASDDRLVDTIAVTSGAVTVSGAQASISLGVVLDSLVGYYVLVAPGAFTDLIGNAFAGIALKTEWRFTTGEFGLIGVTAAGQFFPALFEEHDGQSWILIGRGREGWEFDTDGQGAPGEVGNNLKSPAGFAPKALSDAIVNDLLSQAGKTFPNDVVLRVMRASTTDGTGEYQELRYTNFTGFPNGNSQFSFFLDDANKRAAMQRVNAPASLPGATTGTTTDTIRDHTAGGNNPNRAFTFAWASHNNQKGFAMGQTVGGVDNNNPNTFMWEFTTENHAIPYSEVWLQLQVPGGGNKFSDWIAGFPGAAGDPSFGGDPDGDGISNGIENYFGTDPGVFSGGIHGVEVNGNKVGFSHPLNATPADDVSAAYIWSEDLQTWHADGADNGSGTTVDFAQAAPSGGLVDVTATVTGPVPVKLFVAVKVTQAGP